MARRLVRVQRVIDEAQENGVEPDQLWVDPDDIAELAEDESEEE